MSNDESDRLERLERRLGEVEDYLSILRLVANYGPSVDSGSGRWTASLWVEDGVYDTDALVMNGRVELEAMVAAEEHQGYIHGGSAHVPSLPLITIDGDRAVAIGYSRLYLFNGKDFRVARMSATRWELVRTSSGWRVERRIVRLLDGRSEARELLKEAMPTELRD
jgi:SnoaL-like domain